MAEGAFQTSRKIFDNSIWNDVAKFRIFFYIYGNAVFAKNGVDIAGIHLKRGQFLRSYRNLAKDLAYIEKRSFKNYSVSTIKSKVEQLVKEKRISIEQTDYGTLFTVTNYDMYQGFENYKNVFTEQQPNDSRTTPEQQPNNNKNVNKDKNDKNIKHIVEQSPEPDPETQKRNAITQQVIDYLNKKSGKSFSGKSKDARKLISGRLSEGRTFEDFKTVIDNKVEDWLNDPVRVKYLRPSTLFRPSKFDEYLNEKPVRSTEKGWFDL